MNDKTVINTISTIYFAIVSFISFIILLLTTLFIILQNGLYISDISLPNIKVKQLYIKWNEKIDVSVNEIYISREESGKQTKIEYENIEKYLKSLSLADSWFESIVIEKIIFNDISASFKYKDGQRGFVVVSSPDFYLNSSLYFESSFLNMKIKELKDFKRKINLDGTLYFDPKNVEFSAALKININDDLDAKILIHTDIKKLEYKLIANKEIKDITHLINIANIPKEARYWALDAIDMSYATIDSAKGFIEFDKLAEAYKNIHITATTNKMNYTYDKELDSIHTEKTLLEFKDGVLFIYPQKAYSYGMFLGQSWLKIDFTTKEEMLTLRLLFDGVMNKDMLNILSRYKIDLPFLQKQGVVATNLTLIVNLMTIDIDARGDFFSKKANFDYLGLNIDVFDAYIKLNNHSVEIKNMKAKYKDIATANVDLTYNAKISEGVVSFKTEKITLDKGTLLLENNPINIIYNISPNNDTINIEKSKWKYENFIVNLDKTILSFNLDKLLAKVPTTSFEIEGITSGLIGGNISIGTMKLDLKADILAFDYKGIEFAQSYVPLNISYDEKLTISSLSNILFSIDSSEYDLSNTIVEVDANSINLKNTNLLSTNGLLSTEINAFYNIKNSTGIIDLKDLFIKDKKSSSSFYLKDRLMFSFESLDDNISIHSEELDLKLNITDSGWNARVNSLAKVSNNSEFLKKLKLTQGKLDFHKHNNEKSIRFNADIIYPYKLLVSNNKPVQNYKIKGKVNSEKSFININENVTVKVNNNVGIKIKDSGINIPELLNLLNDINSSSTEKNTKSIVLSASNSYLYVGHDRKVLSDKMDLQYKNSIVTAQLVHKNGHAGFKLNDNKIHLYGENFNHEFMENLLSLARFKDGKLSFSMNGTIKDYDGLFYITNATIIDYKMLNNILAFINTVPSLTTFSLPGYSKSGLQVQSAYMNFNAKNSVFTISDFFLDSKEIDILGSGLADLDKDKIDVTLNLKTDLGSSLSKVPLVGYILLGDDTISTTMKITGKLTNPEVESLLAKDIAVAPINIVKRALLLPYDLLQKTKDINLSK